MFKAYSFESNLKGPHILILGAVHGNEIAGTIAGQKLIDLFETEKLTLKKGKLTIIPVVNELAQKMDTRFVDENLNRVIKFHQNPSSHEQKIANQLISYIDTADILLDLHSTHCEEDDAFAFIDYPTHENLDFLNFVPVQTALAGWPEIYKQNTDIDNFSTEEYAHQKGVSALTVECGYHKAEKAIQLAEKTILNTLNHFGVIEGNTPSPCNKKIITLSSFIIKEKEGSLQKNFKHLDKITKNEIIAIYNTGEKLTSPFDGVIIMPNHGAGLGAEWYYLGKEII